MADASKWKPTLPPPSNAPFESCGETSPSSAFSTSAPPSYSDSNSTRAFSYFSTRYTEESASTSEFGPELLNLSNYFIDFCMCGWDWTRRGDDKESEKENWKPSCLTDACVSLTSDVFSFSVARCFDKSV